MNSSLHIRIHDFYFILILGLCSCQGCDIDIAQIEVSRSESKTQQVDLTTGICLVNEIEVSLITDRKKVQLTNLMVEQLRECFADSVIIINTVPSSRFKEKIPFDISPELLDTLRRTTSFTYLLNVRAYDWGSFSNERVTVEIMLIDLDTRNVIYNSSVIANEYVSDSDDAPFTFTFGRSDYKLIKRALMAGLRDLQKAANKFNKSQVKYH